MRENFQKSGVFFLFVAMLFLSSCSSKSTSKTVAANTTKKISVENCIVPYISLDSIIIAPKSRRLERIFDHLRRLTGFNGVVLYAEKGRIVFEKAYGYRNLRYRKDPLKTTDLFQLGSGSKMFSALAIMILRQEGKVNYDTDIRKYLPGFPYKGITLRLLMNHRSGLPRYMSLGLKYWKDKRIPMSNKSMLALLEKYKPHLYFKPNHGYNYCNTNYALLANIVQAVTGMHFDEFVRKEIFKPLGMDSSFIYNLRGDKEVPLFVEKGIPGYYRRGWRWRRETNSYLNGVMGDKDVYTSVGELYKFDRSWDLCTLLPDSALREAFVPGSPHSWRRRDNYGFGWKIRGGMDSTVYHFGWWKGFRSYNIRDMKHHKTLIVLSNRSHGPGAATYWRIINLDTLPLGNAVPLSCNPKNLRRTQK